MPQFRYDAGTNVYKSCSTRVNGRMLIFGGQYKYKRQISEVGACGLKNVGSLPFNFRMGACNSFIAEDNTQHALLCFDWHAKKDCHT